MGRVYTSRI